MAWRVTNSSDQRFDERFVYWDYILFIYLFIYLFITYIQRQNSDYFNFLQA